MSVSPWDFCFIKKLSSGIMVLHMFSWNKMEGNKYPGHIPQIVCRVKCVHQKQKYSTLYTKASNQLIFSEMCRCRVDVEWCRDSTPHYSLGFNTLQALV